MSQENIEIVRRIYAAWTGNDVPGPVELLDRNIEYVNPEGAIEPGTRRGLEAFTEATQRVVEAWEFWRVEPESLTAVGEQVVAVFRERHQFNPGDKVRLKPDPTLVHLFDEATGKRLNA